MTKRERHALALLLGVALLGHGVRLARGQFTRPPGEVSLAAATSADALSKHIRRSAAVARPLAVGERIDLNTAQPEEIARLPRVGPRLAGRIVQFREQAGGFVDLAELDRVPGVGPALMDAVAPSVTFSDTLRVRAKRGRTAVQKRSPKPRRHVGPTVYLRDLPSVRRQDVKVGSGGGSGVLIDINRATEVQLRLLRGIGKTRARAIVAYRQIHGPFASVADLLKVRGLGPKLVRQLAPQVTVR